MANDDSKRNEDQKMYEDRRLELERIEINAAYDENNGNDPVVDSSNTLGARSSSDKSNINNNNNNTVRSLPDEYQDRTDRYGFIHDVKLPDALTESELKRNNIEKLREKKWILMLKDWSSFYSGKNSDKLVGRVYKGIPNSMRNPSWSKFLDIDTQIKAQSGVYEKMRNLARLYSVDLRQIDLDINRTFRNNIAYKKRYNQRQVQLYNILAAYSIYNTEIGYCQGMATLTALILMYLSDEEKTFWALSQLMSNSKYSMHGFFKQDFPKLIRYVDKHDLIIKTFLPKIHKKFIKYNITSLLYTTKWFLQCYLDALPFSLVLRVWDVYLLKGDIVILAMSYCILRIHKAKLLRKEYDMDKINEFLNHKLPDDFEFTDDEVMIKLEECIEKLQKYRFPTGVIMDVIPENELPKVPFGDFKKIDKNEIINNIAQKTGNNQQRNSLDRSAAVELMAKERLEIEKKKQEEERKLRKQQTLTSENMNSQNANPNLENILNKSGEPILNISDDDEDYDLSDSEDDLNPSKISEYDEDRAERESMISNQTRQSQNHHILKGNKEENSAGSSQVSIDIQKDSSATNSNLSPGEEKPISLDSDEKFLRQSSDYENHKQSNHSDYENVSSKPSPVHVNQRVSNLQKVTNITNKPFQSPKKSFNFTNILPMNTKNEKKVQSTENVTSFQPTRTIPQSQSYIINPNYASTASIISSPPPISPTAFISGRPKTSASHSSAHIASIITNPSYYNSSTNHVNYEYVRSPHGIYTRMNTKSPNDDCDNNVKKSPSFRILPQNTAGAQNIPQSTSSFIISSSSINKPSNTKISSSKSPPMNSVIVHPNLLSQQPPTSIIDSTLKPTSANKRTSSLRSIQNKFQNHFMSNSTSSSKLSSNSNNQNVRVNTPTKLNLQNHSLRIANIQQKHAHLNSYSTMSSPKSNCGNNIISNTNYPTISIISQGPKQSSSNGYQPVFHRQNSQNNCGSYSLTNNEQNQVLKPKHSTKRVDKEDLIEQYDYI